MGLRAGPGKDKGADGEGRMGRQRGPKAEQANQQGRRTSRQMEWGQKEGTTSKLLRADGSQVIKHSTPTGGGEVVQAKD